ncbi:chaperonin 10-like protein [Leptodontidium sp. MPI-SDFR-AT-0119]|nr:chaperonin 10-like protein [Leptodontidium sp. MPI-SDFR-AT-0119]
MSTHAAVVPTVRPIGDEVRVKVQWTASTPLDLHQNDGGVLVTHPQVLGDGTAGTVVEVGDGVERLKVGDQVFGFTWRNQKEKSHQEFCTVPSYLLAKLPPNSTLQEAITLPNNLVTVFHALTTDLSLSLPWPRPNPYTPEHASAPILIWGGSSSVGQYAIQILSYYGYTNILTTSSVAHHALLKSYGAKEVFDYRSKDVVADILSCPSIKGYGGKIPFILDCIGSKEGSLRPLARIAGGGARVAVLLPVLVREKEEGEEGGKGGPVYGMDVKSEAEWREGVDVRGVRTHFYLENPFFKEKLQPEIMPTLLAEGIVKPNRYRIVEGETLLKRAQAAMDALRRKEVSGERLVWRVSEE